ncbi:hypothetical protein [Arthrobacter sp.]|uniref:hypothetical protein n=1 Tax=Arthrobacter sp. TaxID=1667 RepID=UPI0028A147AC|nr:hypothetical protein [Arthrobacter sp.]
MSLSSAELEDDENAVKELQARYPAYFQAVEAVAASESAADLQRFRRWRKEQLRLARRADGPAATVAAGLRLAGGILPAAALLALGLDTIGHETLLWVWAFSAVIFLLGGRFLKRRRHPLWKGVFLDPKGASRALWYCAAQAAAAELIRARERGASGEEERLRAAEKPWALRNRQSREFSDEDYSAITGAR